MIARGPLLFQPAIQKLVFEEQHRVIVPDRRLQQALGVRRSGRINHFQSRRMHEIHFGVRRMKRTAMHPAAGRSTNHDGYRRIPKIMRFGDEVGDLIETARDEIDKLHLAHRAQTQKAHTAGRADDRRLGDGRFNHPFAAKFGQQAVRNFKSPSVDADVFADRYDRGVALHFFGHGLANGVHHSDRAGFGNRSGCHNYPLPDLPCGPLLKFLAPGFLAKDLFWPPLLNDFSGGPLRKGLFGAPRPYDLFCGLSGLSRKALSFGPRPKGMRGSAGSAISAPDERDAGWLCSAFGSAQDCGGNAGVRGEGAIDFAPFPPEAATSLAPGISPSFPRSSSFQPGSKLDFGGITSAFERCHWASIWWQPFSQ